MQEANGGILAALALGIALANWAVYWPKIALLTVPLRPSGHQALATAGAVLGVWALILGTGWLAAGGESLDFTTPDSEGLGLRLLTDEFLSVTDLYNLRHEKGLAADGKRGVIRPLAIPSTFLIGPDGRVLWIDRTRDYRVRSDAPRVLEAVARALGGAAPSD